MIQSQRRNTFKRKSNNFTHYLIYEPANITGTSVSQFRRRKLLIICGDYTEYRYTRTRHREEKIENCAHIYYIPFPGNKGRQRRVRVIFGTYTRVISTQHYRALNQKGYVGWMWIRPPPSPGQEVAPAAPNIDLGRRWKGEVRG